MLGANGGECTVAANRGSNCISARICSPGVTQPGPEYADATRGAGATWGRPYTAGLVTQRPLGCLFEIVETLVLTLIIFFVIQTFVAQPYRVEMSSMERSFEEGQYVLVDKLTPRWDAYSRGDVIVFDPPAAFESDRRTPFIKRVIGLPGETVEVHDGKVWINGTALDEPYVFDGQPTETTGDASRWVIGDGQLFVMGDHRAASSDSRSFGPILRDSVIGRAWMRYWPLDTFGILQTPTYPPPVGNGDVTSAGSYGARHSGARPRDANGRVAVSRDAVNPFILLAALIVTTGGVLAVAVRDARLAGLGLAVVLTGSAFVVGPPPPPAAMAFRVVAGILAAYVVRIAVRRVPAGAGTPLGARATVAAAVAAFAAGLGVTPAVVQRSGPEAAVAAGLAMLVLAAAPVVLGRDPFRIGGGLLVAACGTLMLRAALGGTPTAMDEVAESVFLVALAIAVAVMVPTGRTTGGTALAGSGEGRPADPGSGAQGAA